MAISISSRTSSDAISSAKSSSSTKSKAGSSKVALVLTRVAVLGNMSP